MKDQPQNKKRRPDLKTLLTNKQKKLFPDRSDRFSLQDSETFSEFENQTNLPIPDVQASDFLKYLQVGDFVLVRYEGELYPGKIIDFKEKEEVLISAMKKSASNWKWPSTPDQILYSMDEILQKIDEPIQSGRREFFKVKDLEVYSDLLASMDKS